MMKDLLQEISACTVCDLPFGPRPVMTASKNSKLVIIGQAPGSKVHASGVPWDDPSGDLLRKWLGVDKSTFYDPEKIAIIPMGFCYPGKGKSGDLPPRPECAPLWHERLWAEMSNVQLTLLIGQYAQKAYLGDSAKRNLTENVRHTAEFLPRYIPLPHPSPRNRFWLKKNPWFETETLPRLRASVDALRLATLA